jgi:hypothetical protein
MIAGYETWVSIVNVETEEQSKPWVHTFTKQTENVNNINCQKAEDNCFLG